MPHSDGKGTTIALACKRACALGATPFSPACTSPAAAGSLNIRHYSPDFTPTWPLPHSRAALFLADAYLGFLSPLLLLSSGDLMPEALGSNAGPSPKEYVMVGLATCTSMTIRMFAESSGWPLDMVRVTVREDCKDGAHLPEVRPPSAIGRTRCLPDRSFAGGTAVSAPAQPRQRHRPPALSASYSSRCCIPHCRIITSHISPESP